MSLVSCPGCGHRFDPSSSTSSRPAGPDPTVLQWFRDDPGWSGELSTDEVYSGYVRTTDAPVSRSRFVRDLAHLGVEEVLDDDTAMLLRP